MNVRPRVLFLALLGVVVIATPAGAAVSILGSWTTGTSHTKEAGSNRCLIFTAHVEDSAADMNVTAVTYGGQSMTKILDRNYGTGARSYVAAFRLDETGVAAAGSATFSVTWLATPSGTPDYSSVFLGGVSQSTQIGATGNNGANATNVTTSALATTSGDMVIVAATYGSSTSTYAVDNGFTKGVDTAPSGADGITGYKAATGANETPSTTHGGSANFHAIIGFVVKLEPATPTPTPTPTNTVEPTKTPLTSGCISDGFSTTKDIKTNGVSGTIYDGFIGLGTYETVDTLTSNITRSGQLFMESTSGRWQDPFPPTNNLGPLLYKIVSGDFRATVYIPEYEGSEGSEVWYNAGGLMARVASDGDAGTGEDWIAVDYFPLAGVGNKFDSTDNGARGEYGATGTGWSGEKYLNLERVGNTFWARTSSDGVTWHKIRGTPFERSDLNGLPLQVGMWQCTYDVSQGYVVYDDFSLCAGTAATATPTPTATGATPTPTGTPVSSG